MKNLFKIFLLLIAINSHANESDSMLMVLDKYIANRHEFLIKKEAAIEKLKESIHSAVANNNEVLLYFLFSELANEYDAYHYDSSITYAIKRINLAYKLQDKSKIAFSKSETGNTLIRRGHYREAIDSLLSVNSLDLQPEKRIKHFGFLSRAYYEIADYNGDRHFSPDYRKTAEVYVDSIKLISTENNYYFLWYVGLRHLARFDLDKAVVYYEKILTSQNIDESQKAGVHSALGYIYLQYNQPERAKIHAISSAINDLKSSTKESMALTSLAEQLYFEGDIERAYKYILIAKEDADFYGAKLRQLSISLLLPRIESAQLNVVEKKRKLMLQSILVIGSIALVITTLAFISFIQLSRLRKARKQIIQSNKELISLTDKLREANKIKTEYIGYYFNFSTQYIDKLEGLRKVINSFVVNRNIDGVDRAIKSINPKIERERLFKNFDGYFLHIFPEFITKFNQLLKPDAQIEINDENTLNNDLRIFALIRLGIKDNENIAKILGFSVNTVYTYKTKIKKKALVPSNEFEEQIMKIRSV
jgi:tetratricopeptide (TPR) repeat protein